MYELIQAGPASWYIESPAKVGIISAGEKAVYLVDAGGDKDAGRRVRKLLDEQGWTCKAILTTHSNADHIGGCKYLQQQYHCPVFAPGMERAFTQYPVLEPSFLYGGFPPADLRHKFLMAQPSEAVELTDPRFPQEVEPIPLPGHFLDMVGYRAPDGVVFLADCLSSEATLEKYQVSFIYDVAAYLDTLNMVSQLQAPLFVPAHAAATGSIAPLAEINRQKVWEIAQRILDLCAQPLSFETILQALFTNLGLTMDFSQYVLVGSTVRSYLSWLKDSGSLTARFEDNLLLWQQS